MITKDQLRSRPGALEAHLIAAKIRSSSTFRLLKWARTQLCSKNVYHKRPQALAILADSKFNMHRSRKERMVQTIRNTELPIRSRKIKTIVKITKRKLKTLRDKISRRDPRKVPIQSRPVEMLGRSQLTKAQMVELVRVALKWSMDLDRVV